MALILLTNDDGIAAEGLRSLEEALQGLAETIVVAPNQERSAVSHGLTIRSPLEAGKIDSHHYSLNGTPADCVIYALRHLTPSPPSLVISGINHGANLSDDIMYSGTVAAAREASRHGIPALAVSQAYDEKPIRFKEGARFIRLMVKALLHKQANPCLCLNVNIPVGHIRGVKITRQGFALHFPHYNYLDRSAAADDSATLTDAIKKSLITLDFQAIVDKHISITPLQRDQTDYSTVRSLRDEMPELFELWQLPRIGLIRQKN